MTPEQTSAKASEIAALLARVDLAGSGARVHSLRSVSFRYEGAARQLSTAIQAGADSDYIAKLERELRVHERALRYVVVGGMHTSPAYNKARLEVT